MTEIDEYIRRAEAVAEAIRGSGRRVEVSDIAITPGASPAYDINMPGAEDLVLVDLKKIRFEFTSSGVKAVPIGASLTPPTTELEIEAKTRLINRGKSITRTSLRIEKERIECERLAADKFAPDAIADKMHEKTGEFFDANKVRRRLGLKK